jgi:hypothetical protein
MCNDLRLQQVTLAINVHDNRTLFFGKIKQKIYRKENLLLNDESMKLNVIVYH